MLLLAIDTSAAVTAAVHDGSAVLARELVHDPRHHAELLVPMVERVLADAGVERSQLTDVVAGRGPGPFTGLRVGLVTARTLGLALGVPVHGVGSLDALAQQVVDAGLAAEGETFVVATDARRREVYWARYEHRGRRDPAGRPAGRPPGRRPGRGSSGARTRRPAARRRASAPPPAGPLDPDAGALATVAVRRLAAGRGPRLHRAAVPAQAGRRAVGDHEERPAAVSDASPVGLRPLRWWDVAAVHALEARLFDPDQWSPEVFWSELAAGRWYVVAEDAEDAEQVVGYAGLAVNGAEADVQTVAVSPDAQGRGLGRLLLDALVAEAARQGAHQRPAGGAGRQPGRDPALRAHRLRADRGAPQVLPARRHRRPRDAPAAGSRSAGRRS